MPSPLFAPTATCPRGGDTFEPPTLMGVLRVHLCPYGRGELSTEAWRDPARPRLARIPHRDPRQLQLAISEPQLDVCTTAAARQEAHRR
jgi:hypothetical protein